MDQTTESLHAARGIRIIHLGLFIGLALVGGTFFMVLNVLGQPPRAAPLERSPNVGLVLAGLALAILALAVTVLRGRVPLRRFDQSPDDYWFTNEARGPSIVLWAAVEAAGLLGWMGYVLTGQATPAAAGLLSMIALIMFRPARLQRDGVA